MSATLAQTPDAAAARPRLRLDFLDGLRGLAALYVVFYHASFRAGVLAAAAPHQAWAKAISMLHFCLLGYGHLAVVVFIVLSGYCLMLPVARTEGAVLPGGARAFLRRRAWRILPPYYAALALCLLLFLLDPWLHLSQEKSWADTTTPMFTPGVLLSHLFLVHDWTPYMYRIETPMWSVAVEWQIYFFFPLLLLPLYRRFGSPLMIGAAFALALVGHVIGGGRFDQVHPWFLGLFSMGMAAAALNFAPRERGARVGRLPWAAVAAAAAALVVFVSAAQRDTWRHVPAVRWLRFEAWGGDWPLEVIAGIAAAALIVHCAQRTAQGTPQRLRFRLLDSQAAVRLGVFSYSLYLIHDPVLECVMLAVRRLPMPLPPLLMFGLGVPLAVGVAYVFHLAFERRFMPAHFRAQEERLVEERLVSPVSESEGESRP